MDEAEGEQAWSSIWELRGEQAVGWDMAPLMRIYIQSTAVHHCAEQSRAGHGRVGPHYSTAQQSRIRPRGARPCQGWGVGDSAAVSV